MRSFEHIAQLIRNKRVSHQKGYSQSDLSNLLGYKNGQFISNVERALCNIPLKMLRRVSEILDIPPEDLKTAILKDHENTLNIYLNSKFDKVYGIVGGDDQDYEKGSGKMKNDKDNDGANIHHNTNEASKTK